MKTWDHRRRMKTEEKAKVVAAALGAELIKFLAALAILHQDVLKNRKNCTRTICIRYVYDEFIPFFKSPWCKIASSARHCNNCVPQTAARTFVFSVCLGLLDSAKHSHHYFSVLQRGASPVRWVRTAPPTAIVPRLPTSQQHQSPSSLPHRHHSGTPPYAPHSPSPQSIIRRESIYTQSQCCGSVSFTLIRIRIKSWAGYGSVSVSSDPDPTKTIENSK